MPIHYFSEEIDFSLENKQHINKWLSGLILSNGYELSALNYIFCSDEYLLQINKEHLDHDYYTDIITFDNSEMPEEIESDVFISIDRVKENAQNQDISFMEELHRVMVHGLLHLFGQHDKTEEDKKVMREKEDLCLSLLKI
jgi:probable rRNA maturation factor